MNGGGDQLARGMKSAVFGGPSKTSQKKWDNIWKDYKPEVEHEKKKEDENTLLTRE